MTELSPTASPARALRQQPVGGCFELREAAHLPHLVQWDYRV